jgi:hypothetical protein
MVVTKVGQFFCFKEQLLCLSLVVFKKWITCQFQAHIKICRLLSAQVNEFKLLNKTYQNFGFKAKLVPNIFIFCVLGDY